MNDSTVGPGLAGTRRLGVSYGVHSAERLARHDPLGVADVVTEIPGLLKTSNRTGD